MISFFYPAAQDQSLAYLSQLFGTMNGIIPSAQAAAGTGSITILSTMFKAFNTVVLAIGALIVVYVTVVGVMRTAHEGEFMGKQWNSLWLPIRMVLGIAALVPTGSGYCALQLLMMWVVVQGIGAADTLWNTAISYANLAGSPYAQVNIPSVGVTNQLSGLFEGLVCDATYRYMPAQDANNDNKYMVGPKIKYYCQDHSCASTAPTFSPDASSYALGPNQDGTCGSLTYCNKATSCKDPNSITCQACTAQLQALASIIPVMQPIAQTVAQADYAYQFFYYYSYDKSNAEVDYSFMNQYCNDTNQTPCCVPRNGKHPADSCQPAGGKGDQTQFLDPSDQMRLNANDQVVTSIIMPYVLLPQVKSYDFINTLTQYYTNAVAQAVQSQVVEQAQSQSSAGLSSDLQNAQNLGWILAGGYYYTLAKMNSSNQQSANQSFTFNPGTVATNFGTSGAAPYRNNFNAANTLIGAAANAANSDDGGPGSPPPQKPTSVDKSKDVVSQGATDMLNTFNNSISQQNTNPLVTMQAAASAMFWGVSILFAAFLAATFYAGVIANIDIWAWGFGAIDPAGPAMSLAYFVIVPMLFGLMGIMVTYGALLGVYVPLIPYVVFSIGAIGWLISTIEMMVAGPLVALGILTPSGNHDILGKAEPALMLLFNIFLRPSLMIFGLIAAMLLAGVVVNMINTAWHTVRTSISSSKSVIGEICFLAAYITLIVTALNKAFSAIYVIPERVMSWISGQGAQYGEEAAMGEVRRGAESAGGKTESTIGAGKSSTEGGVKGFKKQQKRLGEEGAKQQDVKLSQGDNNSGGGGAAP